MLFGLVLFIEMGIGIGFFYCEELSMCKGTQSLDAADICLALLDCYTFAQRLDSGETAVTVWTN